MITIKLQWWLWNQMFQYALGKALSLRYKTELVLDHSFIENRFPQKNLSYRHYEMNIFWIQEKHKYPNNLWNIILHPKLYDIKNKILYWRKYIKENAWKYISNIPDNVYLDWFWQTSKYFDAFEKEIKNIFEVKNKIKGNNKKILNYINKNYKNTVSIHIRRWDYITNSAANSWHGICSNKYYQEAIKYIKTKIEKPFFIVFSDEIDWVKKNMNFWKDALFVKGNEKKWYEDLRLMSSCAHHIIANSSFSWWGAYLWKNSKKNIIAPKKWLNNNDYDCSYIIPHTWKKI